MPTSAGRTGEGCIGRLSSAGGAALCKPVVKVLINFECMPTLLPFFSVLPAFFASSSSPEKTRKETRMSVTFKRVQRKNPQDQAAPAKYYPQLVV